MGSASSSGRSAARAASGAAQLTSIFTSNATAGNAKRCLG